MQTTAAERGLALLFTGPDSFSRREAIQRYIAELGPDAAVNLLRLSAEKLAPEELLAAIATPPFLGQRRLVVVEGLFARFEPRSAGTPAGRRRSPAADDAPTLGPWDRLPAALEQLPPTTTLIFDEGPLHQDNPLLQRLRPLLQLREFRPPEREALHQWLHERAKRLGASLSPAAARALVELAGNDLWALHQELTKLALYSKGQTITDRTVRLLSPDADESTIYQLMNALSAGRLAPAFQALHRLLRDLAPPQLLVRLTAQFRLLLQAAALAEAGASTSALQHALGLRFDWQAERALRQARAWGQDRLKAVYDRLLQADLDIKTGRYPPDLALQLLVIDLVHLRADRQRSSAS